MNVGYKEALKLDDFDCIALHDVDLVSEDDRNIYECPAAGPKHMSVAVNKWKYRLNYANYLGGVATLSSKKYEEINGFANGFYGWGGEDDDFNSRIKKHNFTLTRTPAQMARFYMLRHVMSEKNTDLASIMVKSQKGQLVNDGLSNLKYEVVKQENLPLYTHFLVKLPKDPAEYKKKKSILHSIGQSLRAGMDYAAGGLAAKIASQAVSYAAQNEEDQISADDYTY